ncbi:mfs nnp nitrate nitrite transporter [Fusarium heterosporum]|uniref:Nitrate/nitrite transporter n=1 Tax=Fusarium heterosporum TaxID=42747 RepID=A0A8H5TFX8_FUSHE|nr:mfs nnp nitrate nitrite transporter [Fusarium heterosporum]
MGFQITHLWKAPEVNPISQKARSVPMLNPVNLYGRVFTFSWLGFMLAFWAWYTFPPLLTVTIKEDLHLTPAQIANSNIVSLSATFFLRFITGPLCDLYGPRRVFAYLILLGCFPIGLAPLVNSATGLYISRFFIGILGATFVPCQVWCTGFFDKNVVGTANALAGGWGNAGGGITYFIMPAVFDSLVAHQGMSPSKAWRVTFIVPLICLIVCGLGMLFLCPDSPMGSWDEQAFQVRKNMEAHGITSSGDVTPIPTPARSMVDEEKTREKDVKIGDHEHSISRNEAVEIAQGEIVVKPTLREALPVTYSPQTIFHVATYACSFGGELAINAILSSYFKKNFPHLDQTKASNYAAIFGFLNFINRPLGGVIADILYNKCGRNLWLKKAWIVTCGVVTGALLIVIGKVNPSEANGGSIGSLVGLVVVMSIFIEAGNGANFALVPHVHPFANGILSGLTGGGGNIGGIMFAVVFRFMHGGNDYAMGLWVIGIITIALNLAVCWIPPLPKGQIGGH